MARQLVTCSAVFLTVVGSGCAEEQTSEEEFQRVATVSEEARVDGYEADLVPIRGLKVRDDGVIVVGQPQDAQLRFFSEHGEPVGRFGSRGQGPGEFEAVSELGLIGDTTWVFDLSQMRLTLISPGLELLRTIPMPPTVTRVPEEVGEVPGFMRPVPLAVRVDGTFVGTFLRSANADLPEALSDVVLGVITLDGELRRPLVRMPRGRGVVTVPGGFISAPFPNTARTAISRAGERIIGAFTSLTGAEADSIQVWVWDSDGEVEWSRRYPFEPRPIPQPVADSVYDAIVERVPPQFEDVIRDHELPPVYPPLAGLTYGRDGTIWIEKAIRGGQRPYLVLESDGTPLGTVSLAEDASVAAAERGQAWVVEADELGVESVVRYRIQWE